MSSMIKARLDTTLSRMAIHLPFIAAVAMSMHVRVEKCGTAQTNGVWVKFDPDFCGEQNDAELMFLYAHETLHKALMHIWRRGMREPLIWGAACDYVVNGMLADMRCGAMSMPKGGGLMEPRFRGMSEEQVYDILMAEHYEPPPDVGRDLIEDGALTAAHAEIEVLNIAKTCQMAGVHDGLIDLMLAAGGRSQVRWQDVLRTFVSSTIRGGSTWKRRNRRSSSVYLPALREKVLGSIVIFADVSGSMLPLLVKLTDEMQGIIDDVSPELTHVICGDTRVTHVETFERGSRIALQSKGGGGTDFRPLFDEVDKRGWEPDCAVFLTDTYGTFPDVAPAYPVLWGVIGAGARVAVPWGEIIKVER